ncbi:PEP-CTERM sorting domain-containing protein [Bowmanella pacifica]|uniref:Ice-binding protein C-terminal domain-containing protein n=1 Tax=Bowmanella pacifica TaxID=502051 RepID=A0A917YS94_9ALTE|nr:PEP-CTERM sorting domain-containing protein [Bowmanella pacifica]GGO65308.1 hypothetical protein GCM10010982_06810 [Bowmanella pacifica]
MFKRIAISAALLASSSIASAALMTAEQQQGIGYMDTDYDNVSLSFDKFDDLGGTRQLTKVYFGLYGDILSDIEYENRSQSSASQIQASVSASLSLTALDGSLLAAVIPSEVYSFDASIFDGQLDFGGTSGGTYFDLSASKREDSVSTAQAILDYFTGTGQVTTLLSADAGTVVNGSSGNIMSSIRTQAQGIAYIKYEYENLATSIPEPTSLALFGLAFAGLGLARRKTNKA